MNFGNAFIVPTDVHAGLVKEFGLDGGVAVVVIERALEQSFQDDLQLIGQNLERRHGTPVFGYDVQTIPRATGVLKEVRTGGGCPVHRRQ